MKFICEIILKNGKKAILRNGVEADAEEALAVFNQTHLETDFLLTYCDENTLGIKEEGEFLKEKTNSKNEIEILAVVDERVVGTAGIESVGTNEKIKHRAEFGIGIIKEYWELGIGSALTKACISCAKKAGYTRLELNVVSENKTAIALYKREGFAEFGRNPKGFKTRSGKYQELVYMGLDL